MINDIIIYYVKIFVLSIYMNICYSQILNIKKINILRSSIFIFANLILVGICVYIKFFVSSFLSIIILCMINSIIISILYKEKLGISFVVTFISYAITVLCLGTSVIFEYVIYKTFSIENNFINLIIILVIQGIILMSFLRIKKFKNGFKFLQKKLNNDSMDIVITNISIFIILLNCLLGTILKDIQEIRRNLLISFIILGITMFIMIQKTLTMYYKQKLLEDTLHDYQKEIKEKDEQIQELKNEKSKISKITHEFYNRQRALELAVNTRKNDTELRTRIKNLTEEYSTELTNIKMPNKLPITNIPEIDDMFKYMQKECIENNIKFQLKIEGDVFYLIKNIIPKNKLETLIGDHIRDAINAVKKDNVEYKEIFVILGIKDNNYELCIYDTGIEFEIDTLLKLGKERVTTNSENGGSGIGFITTFETMKQTGASLIIEEFNKKDIVYTKAVKIRFDNKSEYRIFSYRAKEIENKDKRIKVNDINIKAN